MKLMIVDDSRAMRLIIKRTLRQAGVKAEVVEAENGAEALELCKEASPDLILCDWHMPVMSGIDFLRALRKEGMDNKFGFITSETTSDMRKMAEDEGAAFLLAKPFTADSLANAIDKVI